MTSSNSTSIEGPSGPRIVITGGAGFFGVNFAHWCARQGATPVIADIAECDPCEYPGNAELHIADVRDRDAMLRILAPGDSARADIVVHAAAALPLWPPAEIFSTNIEGTRTVLLAAREVGVERVVFISSTAVYGVPDKHPLYEDDAMVGVGPYGESKIVAEQVCAEIRASGYCVPVIRPKTFLGRARLGVFQILYDWVHDGKRIPILGSGDNRYQLLDVDDVCDAAWLAFTAPAELANSVFNVGATRFRSVREDIEALCSHAGTGARPFPVPAGPAKLALRALNALNLSPLYPWIYETADKDSYVSCERIHHTLGWAPRYSNAETLIRAYDWYLAQLKEGSLEVGITHRHAWDQSALALLKRWL